MPAGTSAAGCFMRSPSSARCGRRRRCDAARGGRAAARRRWRRSRRAHDLEVQRPRRRPARPRADRRQPRELPRSARDPAAVPGDPDRQGRGRGLADHRRDRRAGSAWCSCSATTRWQRARALRRVHRLLAAGAAGAELPRGHDDRRRAVAPFWRGTFGIAQRLGVPVVPVALRYRDPRSGVVRRRDVLAPLLAHRCAGAARGRDRGSGRRCIRAPASRPRRWRRAPAARSRTCSRTWTPRCIDAGIRVRLSSPRPDPVLPAAGARLTSGERRRRGDRRPARRRHHVRARRAARAVPRAAGLGAGPGLPPGARARRVLARCAASTAATSCSRRSIARRCARRSRPRSGGCPRPA